MLRKAAFVVGLGLVAWAAWSFLRPRGASGQSGEVIGGGGTGKDFGTPPPSSSTGRTSSTSSSPSFRSTPYACERDGGVRVYSPTKGWGCGGGTPGALELYDMGSEPRVIIGQARFE